MLHDLRCDPFRGQVVLSPDDLVSLSESCSVCSQLKGNLGTGSQGFGIGLASLVALIGYQATLGQSPSNVEDS